jgi:hypothetical protein
MEKSGFQEMADHVAIDYFWVVVSLVTLGTSEGKRDN